MVIAGCSLPPWQLMYSAMPCELEANDASSTILSVLPIPENRHIGSQSVRGVYISVLFLIEFASPDSFRIGPLPISPFSLISIFLRSCL